MITCHLEYLVYLSEILQQDKLPPLVGARPEQIRNFAADLKRTLDADLPTPYAEFLTRANGYNYNGVCFFTIDEKLDLPEFLTENQCLRVLHPSLRDCLVLGQSGLWYYAHHLPSATYRALQVDALEEPCYVFADFDDCVSSALEETLELLEDEEESQP